MWYCFYFNKLGCINILISFLRNRSFILKAWRFKECFGLKQASDCYYKLVTKNTTTTFWWYSEENEQSWSTYWILLDVFFYIQLSFSIFFSGFKSQLPNSYNWYVQKYLKGIFHKGMLSIWKVYFTRAILSFSSLRCAMIARLNVFIQNLGVRWSHS